MKKLYRKGVHLNIFSTVKVYKDNTENVNSKEKSTHNPTITTTITFCSSYYATFRHNYSDRREGYTPNDSKPWHVKIT